jgi:hypothetical protein
VFKNRVPTKIFEQNKQEVMELVGVRITMGFTKCCEAEQDKEDDMDRKCYTYGRSENI